MLLQSCLIIFFTSMVTLSLSDHCQSYPRCKNCIRDPKCMWCDEPIQNIDLDPSKGEGVKFRCRSKTVPTKDWCDIKYIHNPENSANYLKNAPLGKHEFQNSSIKITPQHIQLKLRVGQSYSIPFEYGVVEDFPMDLYYLMNLSKRMNKRKILVSTLGNDLAAAMKNVTQNFRLGFGSFVDTVPGKEPCADCDPPYSFKNELPLTADTKQFLMAVGDAKTSGNIDSPEGGLDAIMQTMVCTEEIGWRSKARHLLVYSSDDLFHIVGDGKEYAGIIEPNDFKCHLHDGSHTYSSVYDYPSIAQISEMAKKNNIIIIFAVTSSVLQSYQNLAKRIEGASAVKLSRDSKNVIDIIKAQYNLKSCPRDKSQWKKTLEIYPTSLNEKLILDIEMLCDCPCSKTTPKEIKCLNGGTSECGVCVCDEDHFGQNCECTHFGEKGKTDHSSCINETTKEVCSNSGTCICGVCECNIRENPSEYYYGRLCECDNFTCKRHNGKVCSGEEQGVCDCGVCACRPGWTGDACECPTDNIGCIDNNGVLCSNRGSCLCGSCNCDSSSYTGDFCQDCVAPVDIVCLNGGTSECGVCVCDKDHYGQNCECTHSGEEGKTDHSSCINETTKEVCSNSGTCICGVCECNLRPNPSEYYYGRLCECDNFTCKRHNGKVCSGEDHGVCDCGVCACRPGWTGDACECPTDNNGCIDNNGVLCSNRGSCLCGSCNCNSSSYTGDLCQDCVVCPGGLCKSYKDCVECKAYGTSALSSEDCFKCSIEPILVDYIPDNLEFFGDNTVISGRCEFLDYNDECTFTFNYTTIVGRSVNVYAMKKKECGK